MVNIPIKKEYKMTFNDSLELLSFHWVAYSVYSALIISVVAWFGYNLTRQEKAKSIIRIPFYGFVGFLVVAGVGHHIFTYNSVPWVAQDINRHEITPDKVYNISIKKHKFILPTEKMVINCKEQVLFDVTSEDLVYGFGLFRKDNTMVMQMQVNPGSRNDILWTFNQNGIYDLMSTEYSGPKGNDMFVKDAVEVIGCENISQKNGGVK
jgi:cytochrome c oxidase subunit 2